jgi:hypothetical protein
VKCDRQTDSKGKAIGDKRKFWYCPSLDPPKKWIIQQSGTSGKPVFGGLASPLDALS